MTTTRLVIAPVIVVAVAFVLLLLGNRFLVGGPIDGGTFAWVTVVPLWCAAPAFAGFSWRGFAARGQITNALTCGAAVGGVTAILIWQSVSAPAVDCQPTHTPLQLILPSIILGAIVGGGFALGCWFASLEIAAGRIFRGITFGAVAQLLIIPFGGMAFVQLFSGLCQRP